MAAKKPAKKISTPAKANPMFTGKASTADKVTKKRGAGLVKGQGSLMPDRKGGSGRPV